MIAENLHRIEQEIQESCALASRNPEEITMVADKECRLHDRKRTR